MSGGSGAPPGRRRLKLSGAISGIVSDPHGVPQMGATVQLSQPAGPAGSPRCSPTSAASSSFWALSPPSIRSASRWRAFIPAFRKDILVQPGMRSVLNVSLSTLFSSIQLDYPAFENGGIMTDEWKWVLRSASATRPVMRFRPVPWPIPTAPVAGHGTVFSDTRGIVQLSAGRRRPVIGRRQPGRHGTAFALATSLYGSDMLQVAGNFGLRVADRRAGGGVPHQLQPRHWRTASPEFSVTMRQLYLPGRR